MNRKYKLLILVDWFEPGFKGGGQIRSVSNLVHALKDEVAVYILTGDRDFGEVAPYPGIEADKWIEQNGYHILYASPGFRNYKNLIQIFKAIQPETVYVNGMFSWPSSILPVLIKKITGLPEKLVIAPRGMLKRSAKTHKRYKKELYLFLSRLLGLTARIGFHATDEQEASDVRKHFGNKVNVFVISNAPAPVPAFKPVAKNPGSAKLIFIGRVHPVKNLYLLLEVIEQQEANIQLTIVTSEYELSYRDKCLQKIQSLPQNISVQLKEHVPHSQIHETLLLHHMLVLPTTGENFGHAIFESFAAGRPVLISDQTPWKNLAQKKIGWDLPLENKQAFSAVISNMTAMRQEEFDSLCKNSWNYANNWAAEQRSKEEYLKCLFN